MPKNRENQPPVTNSNKGISIGPYEYMKQLLFGGQLPEMYTRDWPQLSQSFATAGTELPNEAAQVRRVRPMSLIESALNSNAYAKTTPFGNILLNRNLIENDKQNLDDVLVHELTHVGQGKSAFLKRLYPPVGQQLENEAINREALRNVRREDINLPRIK